MASSVTWPPNLQNYTDTTQRAYPTPIRVLSFEAMHAVLDPGYDRCAEKTFASELLHEFQELLASATQLLETNREAVGIRDLEGLHVQLPGLAQTLDEDVDVLDAYRLQAISRLQSDRGLMEKLNQGIRWVALQAFIKDLLPEGLDDRWQMAYELIPKALDELLGPQNRGGWHTYKDDYQKTCIKKGANSGGF